MNKQSPKKYIETRARNLPIYKCIVNKDWQEARIADVVVMRQHVNGNITAGIYLVDLACLGIKDTFYFFNVTEEEIIEKFSSAPVMFEEIDYALAHNIIYAAHDFAMEFDIHPHPGFAITKYILEEDNEDVPLIDIAVGDERDGKPHLIVRQPGQYADALAKLKKYAGEGNYHYTMAIGESFDEEEDADDEEENYFFEHLDDYGDGTLTALNVQYINNDDLMDTEKVSQRNTQEQLTIHVELLLRLLKETHPEYFDEEDIEDSKEYAYIENAAPYPAGGNEALLSEFYKAAIEVDKALQSTGTDSNTEAADEAVYINILKQYAHNPLVVTYLYENSNLSELETVKAAARHYLEALAPQYPLATLSMALTALADKQPEQRFDYIYNEPDPQKTFPDWEQWSLFEWNSFWMIQSLAHLRKNDLKQAIHYYALIAEADILNLMLWFVQLALLEEISKLFGIENDKQEDNIPS